MNTFQLFYTVCKKGLSSGAGFQTYSMSEGITQEEREEIERYGVYVPPDDLPSQPGPEEIENDFPVAFASFQLSSGRYGVCRTKYIGQDYSGRYGNYFCHALIAEEGFPDFYPIELYGSSLFREKLTEQEENNESKPLESRPVNNSDLSKKITFESVVNFLQEDERESIFNEMLTALISSKKSGRRLIICDDNPEHAVLWFAALQMAFPYKLAQQITFTTYAYDPEETNLLVCSTSRTSGRFEFSEAQRDFSHYIFDFIEGTKSKIEDHYEFVQIVNAGYVYSKENLKKFHAFLEQFNYDIINEEIDAACYLFSLQNKDFAEINKEKMAPALAFAQKYAPASMLNKVVESINSSKEKLTEDIDLETIKTVHYFLLESAKRMEQGRYADIACQFFFNACDHLVFDGNIDIGEAIQLYDDILDHQYANRDRFVSCMHEEKRLNALIGFFEKNGNAEYAVIYFGKFLELLIMAGYDWYAVSRIKMFSEFSKSCISLALNSEKNHEKYLCRLFTDIAGNIENAHDFFVQPVSYALGLAGKSENKHEIILRCFMQTLENKENDLAFKIRLKLLSLGQYKFIYEEFKTLFTQSKDKVKFFSTYRNAIFAEQPKYKELYFSDMVKVYFDFPLAKRKADDLLWLLEDVSLIDNALLTEIITEIEENTPFSLPGRELKKIKRISELKKERKIKTEPDITGLILFAVSADTQNEDVSRLLDSKPSLKRLDIDKYKAYLNLILPVLFQLEPAPEEHEQLLDFLRSYKVARNSDIDFIDYLARQYISVMIRQKKYDTIISFLVYYLRDLSKKANLYPPIQDSVVTMLAKQSTSYLKRLEGDLRNREKENTYVLTAHASKNCGKLFEEVKERKRNSFFGRISSFFSRVKIKYNTWRKSKQRKPRS